MDKNQEFDELLRQSQKRAGVETLLELQSMYEKFARQQDTVFRSDNNRRTIITTNST